MATHITKRLLSYFRDWRQISKDDHRNAPLPVSAIIKWEKPQSSLLKLNVDAIIDTKGGIMGFGQILRDNQGQFKELYALHGWVPTI